MSDKARNAITAAGGLFFYRQQAVYLPPIQRCAAGGDFTLKVSVCNGRLRRPGDAVPTARGKRGRDTKVSLPLLTPQPFLRTRLPSVARLKARGPQGRLVLQGTPLDGSEAFRSGTLPPCTGWPRTVMRGKSRKLTSGPESVPKSARRTEPSPRNPRFAARPQGVAAQRRVWGSQEGAREPYGVLSPFAPVGGHRHPRPPKAANDHALRGRKVASSGAPLYRRRVCPLLQIKQKNIFTMRHIGRCANREVGFSSKNVAFSLALCAQYTV